jgi:hypothetical protein
MNRDYLENYKAKEGEKFRRYAVEFSKDIEKGSEPIPYFDSRIRHAAPPLVIADTNTFPLDGQKIWSQIPFSPTLLIPLRPTTRKEMLNLNGFEVEEIQDLIKLSKEYGKIHFCLPADPLLYEGLDHLDPIFKEMNPLTLWSWHPKDFISREEVRRIKTELATVAKINYKRFVLHSLPHDTYNHSYFKYFMGMNQDTYVKLKILGLSNTTDLILDKMINSPIDAARLFNACGLLIDPLFQIIRAHENNSLRKLQQTKIINNYKSTNEEFQKLPFLLSTESGSQFPIEIGKFLIKKLALNPSDYLGCRLAIDKYKDNTLYTLLSSLDRGISDQSVDETRSSINEINTIMENVWMEAKKVGNFEKLTRAGLSITIGLAGVGLTPMFPGPGLLANLGFLILGALSHEMKVGIGIARKISKDYLVNIYDFKTKHSVD